MAGTVGDLALGTRHGVEGAPSLLLAVLCAFLLACTPDPETGSEAAPAALDVSRVPEPLLPFHAAELDLEGTWLAEWIPGRDSTRLEIVRVDERSISVTVSREPDYGTSFHYQTTAEWKDGGLWPRGAEANTHGDVLYPARVDGRECLVPRGSLEAFAAGEELWSIQQELAFRRVGESPRKKRERLGKLFEELQRNQDLERLHDYSPGPDDENL